VSAVCQRCVSGVSAVCQRCVSGVSAVCPTAAQWLKEDTTEIGYLGIEVKPIRGYDESIKKMFPVLANISTIGQIRWIQSTISKYYARLQIVFSDILDRPERKEKKGMKALIDTIPHILTSSERHFHLSQWTEHREMRFMNEGKKF